MFIEDTTSVPRTPLFTLVSVPAFQAFGVNEDAALITNVILLGITSIFLGLFVQELFKHKAYNEDLATLSIVLFNLMPATYGLARLYMSEILQAFFVVLISYLYVKFKDSFSYKRIFCITTVRLPQ